MQYETVTEEDITEKNVNMWGLGGLISRNSEVYGTDGHGSVDSAYSGEEEIREYNYDAYGNRIGEDGEDDNPYRYCSENFDEETGLIYLRNRYYDPELGRFITEDPIKDGLNWYVYCGNNPVAFVDPSGREPERKGEEDFYSYITELLIKKVDYENTKDVNTTTGAQDIKDKIMNLDIVKSNNDLYNFIDDVINSTYGSSIQQVSALMFVMSHYMYQLGQATGFFTVKEVENVTYHDFYKIYEEKTKEMEENNAIYYHSSIFDLESEQALKLIQKWVDPQQRNLSATGTTFYSNYTNRVAWAH